MELNSTVFVWNSSPLICFLFGYIFVEFECKFFTLSFSFRGLFKFQLWKLDRLKSLEIKFAMDDNYKMIWTRFHVWPIYSVSNIDWMQAAFNIYILMNFNEVPSLHISSWVSRFYKRIANFTRPNAASHLRNQR